MCLIRQHRFFLEGGGGGGRRNPPFSDVGVGVSPLLVPPPLIVMHGERVDVRFVTNANVYFISRDFPSTVSRLVSMSDHKRSLLLFPSWTLDFDF